ncbi:O-antigen ligase family protein [Halodesulfovibrio marinisediminis]|uniref:O-antigen ligase n=1 Tax=Halodesulfovibrio marinisediminis DSM 17456 TaxID=1121457 RepID=A0A1N6H443_9BACT|nr:O-antigen ligase family protein [Halodesulfovibrio marinisediminis]SIO14529.1 O-antigen ligase [Halodesulfovibrio marinisediminis DSM 17456]
MLYRSLQNPATRLCTSFLFFSTSALMLALGLHFGVKPALYSSGIASFLLTCLLISSEPKKALLLLTPIPFILFVLITPGAPFADARIAGRLACALFAGVGLQLFLTRYSHNTLFLLAAALSISVITGCTYSLISHPEIFNDRLSLHFNNPQYLAFTAAITIFICICYAQTLPKILKHISYVIAPIAAFTIMLTVSRSTYVGLLFSCGIYTLIFHANKIWKYALIAILLLAIAFPLLPAQQQNRLTNTISAPLQDRNIRTRLGMWYSALQGFSESPILGNGLRSFTDFDIQYRSSHLQELKKVSYLTVSDDLTHRWPHPHSLYVSSLFGWGISGSMLLILAFIPAIRFSKGRTKHFLILVTLFNLGYGLTDVYIKSDEGAFFLFFPLGMAYGSILYERYSDALKDSLPEPKLLNAFTDKTACSNLK